MANQMRVTVVATGLGRKPRPGRAMAAQSRSGAACGRGDRVPPVDHAGGAAADRRRATDYAMLDKPTVQRQRAVGDGLRRKSSRRICWIFQHSCAARRTEALAAVIQ